MQNIIKKIDFKKLSMAIISVLSLVTIIASCFIPTIYAASKSTYYSTIAFATTLTGKTREYSGQHMAISMTPYIARPASPYPYNNIFTVTLYRKNFLNSSKIGTVTFPRSSGTVITKRWSNVGPGNYYFFFSKGHDGANIKANNVKMFNY